MSRAHAGIYGSFSATGTATGSCPPPASGLKSIAESTEEFRRVSFFAVAPLPRLQEWLRSPFTPKRNCGEDAADGGVRAAVSVRRVWLAVFAAVVSCEF